MREAMVEVVLSWFEGRGTSEEVVIVEMAQARVTVLGEVGTGGKVC